MRIQNYDDFVDSDRPMAQLRKKHTNNTDILERDRQVFNLVLVTNFPIEGSEQQDVEQVSEIISQRTVSADGFSEQDKIYIPKCK